MLFAILGLEHLADAQERLAAARQGARRSVKRAKAELTMLRRVVADVDDERASRVKAAIAGNEWDLVAVRDVLSGVGTDDAGSELELLRRLATLEGPSQARVDEVVTEARDAADELEAVAADGCGHGPYPHRTARTRVEAPRPRRRRSVPDLRSGKPRLRVAHTRQRGARSATGTRTRRDGRRATGRPCLAGPADTCRRTARTPRTGRDRRRRRDARARRVGGDSCAPGRPARGRRSCRSDDHIPK